MFFPIREKKLRYKDDEFIINGDKFFFFLSYKESTFERRRAFFFNSISRETTSFEKRIKNFIVAQPDIFNGDYFQPTREIHLEKLHTRTIFYRNYPPRINYER